MRALVEKLILWTGPDWSKLLIISSGMLCGMVFNHVCGNICIDPQGILGGAISSILIIWLN